MNTDGLWQAVAARDRRADGLFVYAVRSTRVFCRPSCPSRRPRRERVEFYPSPATALAGGYRPCQRCKPDGEISSAPEVDRVRRACEAVARRPDAPWTAASLAKASRTTVSQLQRAFRSTLGLTPREYVAACRRQTFLGTLRQGRSVTDAIYESGYGSPSRVYGAIQLPGMTPATYGRGGRGATIEWTTASSPAGRILVAATARGLCFVEVGDDVAELARGLEREFPHATITRSDSPRLRALAAAARAVVQGDGLPTADVPVDIQGTAFQWRVWRALTKIPRGETRTYAAVAAAIGEPKSSRAVAAACAVNPLALVVPCHRVVPASGGVGGYRWGADVKEKVLTTER